MGDELTGGQWVRRGGILVYRLRRRFAELTPGPCINCGLMAIGLRCRTCRDEITRQQRQHREAA